MAAVRSVRSVDPWGLWGLAVAGFVVGDVATTLAGLSAAGIVETGPVAAPLLDRHGVAALPVLKAVTVAVAYLAWRLLPAPHAAGIPTGLALVGAAATGWNLSVLLAV